MSSSNALRQRRFAAACRELGYRRLQTWQPAALVDQAKAKARASGHTVEEVLYRLLVLYVSGAVRF